MPFHQTSCEGDACLRISPASYVASAITCCTEQLWSSPFCEREQPMVWLGFGCASIRAARKKNSKRLPTRMEGGMMKDWKTRSRLRASPHSTTKIE